MNPTAVAAGMTSDQSQGGIQELDKMTVAKLSPPPSFHSFQCWIANSAVDQQYGPREGIKFDV